MSEQPDWIYDMVLNREEPPPCECGHSWGQHPYPGQRVGPPSASRLTDGSCGHPGCACRDYAARCSRPEATNE